MVKLLTGNALLGGEVLWWTGQGWSEDIEAAAGLTDEDGKAVLAREAPGERVNDLALVEAAIVDGRLRPLKIRERIRGFGPTVRADLVREGRDWQ